MTEPGVIGRVVDVRSTTIRVALDVGSRGFTKVGPDGLQTVGVVNSYITVPAGAHRVVGIVSGVYITGRPAAGPSPLLSQDDTATYELEATVVGRFEGDTFKSGLTGYPPLHAPVQAATPGEVKNIFLPKGGPSLRIGTSAVANEQVVHLDANLLLGHHCAVVGSTGSGKSCTVTALIDGLLDHEIPNGHIVVFDINGEYAQSFAASTPRGMKTRPLVLGPKPGTDSGLFLPHWFMNNEEHLNLLRASEGVQAPVLQRAIADARVAGATTNVDMLRLQNVGSSLALVEGAFTDSKGGAETAFAQLAGLKNVVDDQAAAGGVCAAQWAKIKECLDYGIPTANVPNAKWTALTPEQRDVLAKLIAAVRTQVSLAFDALGMGSGQAAPDFDAPIYYSLQELCDYFLPARIQLEQAADNRIAGYVATLQMRLSRLLADGRYDFITRVEKHADPLGNYLKALMGVDPKGGNSTSDWPAAAHHDGQSLLHGDGPSVTIFDLSLVANDVLENVTALLGRILFDFAVRSQPRAEHPVLLVLEEAHRFIPSRQDSAGSASRSAAVFERIAKEGRKFGLSLLLASQRPSELSETVIAQCGTVIAHRLTHEADQGLLRHATALSSRALLDQLPSLAQQHALVTGVSTGVPVAVRVRDVENPPKSDDPNFISTWADADKLADLPDHIDRVVKDWQGDLPCASMPDDKRMKLRYAGVCRICGTDLPTRGEAIYERSTKTVRCVKCPVLASADPEDHVAAAATAPVAVIEAGGIAGSSARREYERRKTKDEERLRQKWGRLGGIAVALSEEKQSTKAWATGAVGEERLGARLDSLVSDFIAVLHDRRIPGAKANIDHIAITAAGIWVIDAKRYKGRPELKVEGGILRPRVEKIVVGRRDCTKLVDGVLKQIEFVRDVVGDLPVTGVLCFVEADWPLIGGSFTSRDVHVLWPKRLAKLLAEDAGDLDVIATREALTSRFKPA